MEENVPMFMLKGKGPDDVDVKYTEGCLASWKETLVVTGSFMAAYTAYLAIQSLQSSLNQEAGLGVVSLACLYGTILLSGILTPSFIGLVGAKWSLVIAWVCHTLYTASNFYPTWATLIPASVLLGAIAGPQWTAASLYITTSGERMAKKSGRSLHVVLSKVNGVFFMGFESTQITGNLISSLVLQQSSYTNSDNTTATRTCGADDCPAAANATEIIEPEKRVVYTLLGIFLACDVLAVGLAVLLLPPLGKSPTESDGGSVIPDPGLRKTLLSWFTALSDPKLLTLVLFFVSSAMSQGILYADYTKSFVSCVLGVSMVGFIMASHGVVTAAVASITSFAAEYIGRLSLLALAFICNMSLLLTLLLWTPDTGRYAVFFVIPAIWGIAVGLFHTQFNTLVGLMFPEKRSAAFANYHTWNAIGFTITFAYGGVLCMHTKLYICITMFGLGMLGYLVAEVLDSRQKRSAIEENIVTEESSKSTQLDKNVTETRKMLK